MRSDAHGRAPRVDGDRRRRPPDGFRLRDNRRFARLVREASNSLPTELARLADLAVTRIEAVPAVPADVAAPDADPPLAVYDPDRRRLVVFRRACEARAESRDHLFEVVRAAVGRAVSEALGRPHDFDDW